MSCNNSYNILAVIHHQFCRVQGLLDLFKQKSMTCTWPTLTLPPACTEREWPSLLLQCKLLKIIVFSREGLQACFAVSTEIHCGFTIDHQRAKRRISSLWEEMLSSNFLFLLYVHVFSSNLLKSFSFFSAKCFYSIKVCPLPAPFLFAVLDFVALLAPPRSELPVQSLPVQWNSQTYTLLSGIKA